MIDPRRDPDALIERLREDERRSARGRLRIYFGSSAGVGKTFAMLVAAKAARAEGIDVIAGVIETHGRRDTIAQIGELEILLPKPLVRGDGKTLAEFDIDAALERRPALILVDELAHSNVEGSRHPKRWQDVGELLAAGIDVWTTLNVQHLETLNDVIGGITGVRVQETLPDTFFDRADEVVLIDTPADELLARLHAGKVYGEAQAQRAAANFFRKGNLMALRELALRRTADRVEDDVQTYRAERSIGHVWKTESALLCCIGPDDESEHVVRSAALLAQQLAVSWHAVYVETPALQRLPESRRSAILAHVTLAEDLGASSAVLPRSSVAPAVVEYARAHNLSKIVMGHNRATFWRPAGTLSQQVGRLAADLDLIEVGRTARPAAAAARTSADAAGEEKFPLAGYLATFVACAAVTAAAHALNGVLDQSNIVMVYLLAVVGIALRWGRGAAVLSALLNVAAFDFFVVPPRYSFAVGDLQYLLTFAVMLTVGLVVGQLTAGLRYQARVATHREQRSHSLFELARRLSGELVADEVIATAVGAISREFHAQTRVFALDDDDRLVAVGAGDAAAAGLDAGTAQWSFDHRQPAGLGTDTLPGSAWHYLPLVAPMRARGVLALKPERPRFLAVPEQRRQLETFAALAAIALERIHYVDVAGKATVQIESERLRNTLLSALSHDLRTPLAGLTGLAETLKLSHPTLEGLQKRLVDDLYESAARMSAQVLNLLDMARMESGAFALHKAWNSVEELVGSALRASHGALGGRHVTTSIPATLPLVQCDAVLIERVLLNLLENIAKYTPDGANVGISAQADEATLTVAVEDDGPGLPKGQEEAIFEKFARGVRESATTGMGLGLAICRAIVAAHGGRITAANRRTGGASFAFTLPLTPAPRVELEDDPVEREAVDHGR